MLKNSNGQINSFWKITGAYAAFFVVTFFMATLLSFALGPLLKGLGMADNLTGSFSQKGQKIIFLSMMFLQEIIMIAVPVFIWTVMMKRNLSQMGLPSFRLHIRDFWVGIVWGFLAFSTVFAGIIVTGSASVSQARLQVTPDLFIYLILFIFVGFAEETLSRGYMMAVLLETKKKTAAVVISALIFSFFHLGNSGFSILAFINIFLLGVLFACMYLKTGNIWICIGYHMIWNYVQGNIYGFAVSGIPTTGLMTTEVTAPNLLNGGVFGPEGGLLVTLVTVLSLILLHFAYREKKESFSV